MKTKLPDEFRALLREMGRQGGKKRMEKLSAEERSALAKKAGQKAAEVHKAKAAARKKVAKKKKK